ncbi:TolC family protein [Flavobacterium sp. 3HN19-14]|uniref:TolC family protein n=1 Tax=Flavobacterium sp. 3HN19-14 TaxID=3448133 RepID=UPI003EE22EFC
MKNKSLYKIAVLAVIAVIVQACFSAKDYTRPDVKTDNLYRTNLSDADSTSMADLSWDKLFTDPILQGYIKTGLQNNLDIRIAIQNINAAEANMKQGKAGYLPSVNAGADWTHQQLSKNNQLGALTGDRSIDQFQLTGTVSWEADIWGKSAAINARRMLLICRLSLPNRRFRHNWLPILLRLISNYWLWMHS